MSFTRYGGFKPGKLDYFSWDERQSPEGTGYSPPKSDLSADYVKAQGIWSLNSTMQFPFVPPIVMSLVTTATTTLSTTINVPGSALTGDIAVLFDVTTGAAIVPTGWTSIYSDKPSAVGRTASYKLITADDIGATISGQSSSGSVKIMLIFRPSTSVTTLSFAGLVSEESTITVPVKTIVASSSPPETTVFAWLYGFSAAPAMSETWWDNEYTGIGGSSYLNVYYEQQTTATERTITSTIDTGSWNFASGFTMSAL